MPNGHQIDTFIEGIVASKTTIDQDWLNANVIPLIRDLKLDNLIPHFDEYLQNTADGVYSFAENQSVIISKDL